MVKKLQKLSNDKKKTGAQLSSTVKDSAQQIWLAGLGAFSKAQEEGGKVFEALVKEGLSIQRKTQAAAEEKISVATHRVTSMASDIGSRAAGQWDKLENIFEDRVATALSKLGVPTAHDLDVLNARIDALAKSLGKAPPAVKAAPVKAAPVKAAPARKAAAKPAAKKAAAKPVAKKAAAKPAVKAPAAKPAAKKPAAKARVPFPKVAARSTEPAAQPADDAASA
ncbi:MAG: phasin family protein [Giesbergeria sp.]|jgi:poly(hydroxyalkanoate) granule-associated protein|nr:phasin family protein [Giesbergeria sp.]